MRSGASAAARGERVLRVAGAETERWISYAGLADLLGQIPVSYLADLPDPQRAAVNAVLLRGPVQRRRQPRPAGPPAGLAGAAGAVCRRPARCCC